MATRSPFQPYANQQANAIALLRKNVAVAMAAMSKQSLIGSFVQQSTLTAKRQGYGGIKGVALFSLAEIVHTMIRDADLEKMSATQVNALNAMRQAIVSSTERDEEEFAAYMQLLADRANEAILERYLQEFPSSNRYDSGIGGERKSGAIEDFLRRFPLVSVDGLNLRVDLSPASSDEVPHFFRLNYGTQSKVETKPGYAPPKFQFRFTPSATTTVQMGAQPRSKAFTFPGGRRAGSYVKGYSFGTGPTGKVRIFGLNTPGGGSEVFTKARHASGIAPSYFVEYGVADAFSQSTVSSDLKATLDRIKKRKLADTARALRTQAAGAAQNFAG